MNDDSGWAVLFGVLILAAVWWWKQGAMIPTVSDGASVDTGTQQVGTIIQSRAAGCG